MSPQGNPLKFWTSERLTGRKDSPISTGNQLRKVLIESETPKGKRLSNGLSIGIRSGNGSGKTVW
jgi:hypothetical protein